MSNVPTDKHIGEKAVAALVYYGGLSPRPFLAQQLHPPSVPPGKPHLAGLMSPISQSHQHQQQMPHASAQGNPGGEYQNFFALSCLRINPRVAQLRLGKSNQFFIILVLVPFSCNRLVESIFVTCTRHSVQGFIDGELMTTSLNLTDSWIEPSLLGPNEHFAKIFYPFVAVKEFNTLLSFSL